MTAPTTTTTALIRADLCRLLTLAFSRPAPEPLDDLRGITNGLIETLGPDHALTEPLTLFSHSLGEATAPELEPEYHLLFTTQMLATPHESSYHRTSRGAVLGDITGFYQAFGLQSLPGQGAADAISNELAFLAWLAIKEVYAGEHGKTEEQEITRDATRKFIEDHLGRWTPAFVERLLNATVVPFYVEAGGLLIATLNEITREFDIGGVTPLDADQVPVEPDTIACPAAGTCPIGS